MNSQSYLNFEGLMFSAENIINSWVKKLPKKLEGVDTKNSSIALKNIMFELSTDELKTDFNNLKIAVPES